MSDSPPLNLFIIYAREDQPALLELKAHLRILEMRAELTVWYDGEILPGEKWYEAIKAHLEAADIVLLFISKYFFNSEHIGNELKKAIERDKKGEATVIPVILNPCLWDAHKEIAALQVLPKDGKPISGWRDQDEAWLDVARWIQKTISRKRSKREADSLMSLDNKVYKDQHLAFVIREAMLRVVVVFILCMTTFLVFKYLLKLV